MSFDLERYAAEVFLRELDDDMAAERRLSRRGFLALAIVIALLVARQLWFV
jgi:hypothetical protein